MKIAEKHVFIQCLMCVNPISLFLYLCYYSLCSGLTPDFLLSFMSFVFLFLFLSLCCKTAATTCEEQRDQASQEGLVGAFVPECNVDGSFKPEQCWGSTGYCWCVNEHGTEVPRTKVRGKPDCSKKGNLKSN